MFRSGLWSITAVAVLLGMVAALATVPSAFAAAGSLWRQTVRMTTPDEIPCREDGRGLMTRVWVNGAGPFDFAIDTGAGYTVVSERVASEARLTVGRAVSVQGLSGRISKALESSRAQLAAGTSDNLLPSLAPVTVTSGLPLGVDGLLDPAVALWPMGFTIDLAGGSLTAFDPRTAPIDRRTVPDGGAVTPWQMRGESRRPYVALGDGRIALIDTGSRFGLAVRKVDARSFGINDADSDSGARVRDVGGGVVTARRTTASRVMLGGILLENVPTDVLTGVVSGTPILLGRDALRPFVISFDPRSRLIRIALR